MQQCAVFAQVLGRRDSTHLYNILFIQGYLNGEEGRLLVSQQIRRVREGQNRVFPNLDLELHVFQVTHHYSTALSLTVTCAWELCVTRFGILQKIVPSLNIAKGPRHWQKIFPFVPPYVIFCVCVCLGMCKTGKFCLWDF